MLKKLLKYDLKWIFKIISIFYILAFIFAILTRIFTNINNSFIFSILGAICSGITICMLINSLINGIIRSWVRFIKNIYKDEAYLTHTLPVSKKTIYLSKVLAAITTSFVSVLVIVICLFISYYSKNNILALKSFLELLATTYETSIISIVISISLIFFLEILFIIIVGYVGIIIGHKSNQHKLLKTFLYGFGLYFLTMIFTLLIIYLAALFNNDIMNLFKTTSQYNINIIKNIIIYGIILYTIYNIIYYIIGSKEFEKGVNID